MGRRKTNTVSYSRFFNRLAVSVALGGILFAAGAAEARNFSLFTYAYLDEERTPSVRVLAEVSYPNLVFFKQDDGFRARYEIRVAIEDKSKRKIVRTAVIHGDALVQNFEETTLRENKNRPSRTFALGPGEYKIEATLTVNNTHIVCRRAAVVVVPDFLASGIGFSTPVVLSIPRINVQPFVRWEDFDKGVNANPELIDETLTVFDKQPAVKFALYLEESPSEKVLCDVFYEVLDVTKKRSAYGKNEVQLAGVNDDFVVSFDVDDWEPGPYQVNFRVVARESGREATTSVRFNVDITRAMLGAFFDETMGMLSLIASGQDLKPLREAPVKDRPFEWTKFWEKRDPDPATRRNEALEEYLTRVRVVSEKFSAVQPGWRTDRGQVYIKYGAPERVQRVSDPQYRGEYEIWRYYSLNRVFVFYDMFGLGDFRLVEGDLF